MITAFLVLAAFVAGLYFGATRSRVFCWVDDALCWIVTTIFGVCALLFVIGYCACTRRPKCTASQG